MDHSENEPPHSASVSEHRRTGGTVEECWISSVSLSDWVEDTGEVVDFGVPVLDFSRDEFWLENARVGDHGRVDASLWGNNWKGVISEFPEQGIVTNGGGRACSDPMLFKIVQIHMAV